MMLPDRSALNSAKVTDMCGRCRLTAKERSLRDHFSLDDDPPWPLRWNIAPPHQVAAIREHPNEPQPIFVLMRWSLIPYWAKDQSFGLRTINAMSETAAEKPAFRDALKRRGSLIPADDFFEGTKTGPKEKPAYDFGADAFLTLSSRGNPSAFSPKYAYATISSWRRGMAAYYVGKSDKNTWWSPWIQPTSLKGFQKESRKESGRSPHSLSWSPRPFSSSPYS